MKMDPLNALNERLKSYQMRKKDTLMNWMKKSLRKVLLKLKLKTHQIYLIYLSLLCILERKVGKNQNMQVNRGECHRIIILLYIDLVGFNSYLPFIYIYPCTSIIWVYQLIKNLELGRWSDGCYTGMGCGILLAIHPTGTQSASPPVTHFSRLWQPPN
jgi:hypothetical protein